MPSVGIVGAGMAGLTCARRLQAAGFQVTLFDKSRGPGGRMSTRRRTVRRYDHGAPYFTAKTPAFQAVIDEWLAQGQIAPWGARFVSLNGGHATPTPDGPIRYVGVPRMSALTRHLSQGLDLQTGVRIGIIHPIVDQVELFDVGGQSVGRFDHAVVSTPAEQAVPLVASSSELSLVAARARMTPCLTAMVTFSPALSVDFDVARVAGGPLDWIGRNASKPQRPDFDSWVLHATSAWSVEHLEDDVDTIAAALVDALQQAVGVPRTPAEVVGHRWRYARADGPFDEDSYLDSDRRLGVCGDWCGGAQVEGAWRSGHHLAGRLMEVAGRA
ncbi:MAG: FAD-dependent oxidoreductase [Myxococcota bacterium]